MPEDQQELVELAWRVRENAYAPYSNFAVGAVILSDKGKIFVGCNVENISYGLTNCAERVALGSAVAAGIRHILKVVIVADSKNPISPCGACRQVLAEFGNPEMILVNREKTETFMLSDLLPRAKVGILE